MTVTPAETVFVDVLTDEELSVVARPGAMPVMPFLDTLGEAEQETARRSAYRSLMARGIVDPPTPEAIAAATALRDGSVELMVRQDIRSVVALREAAQVVVALARTTAATQDYWYAHLVDDVVLLEEVGRDGLHRFALAEAAHLGDLAVAAAVHPDAGDGDGPRLPVDADAGDPTPPDAVLERLGAAFLRVDIVVRRPGDTQPPTFAVLSGPDGCWCIEGGGLDGEPPSAAPLTADAARARVADAVAAVRAEAVTVRER
ncbi:MAG: hypothetical protein H0X12_11065 [Nocardioides sp.]|nr:hypothetical protein [Nocardioides sp.]